MIKTDHLEQAARDEPGGLRGDLREARRGAVRDLGAAPCEDTGKRVRAFTRSRPTPPRSYA
ncbi:MULTISPECIES: hypothetical protein [unclassified Streptomyces]|uniref:hypothetical protein n=1 Tax=unclassified Streptomyces TaxID=2593676 RepID=UPI0035E2F3D6